MPGDTFSTSLARNLPYHAAMAASFGLPADIALRSITLSAAEIVGAADRLGSLDRGKDATLILTDGDPLEIRTQVLRAFVMGREISLNNRQRELNRKYTEKYQQE
jgi:imidazolonepropionase-like amidohydrolase